MASKVLRIGNINFNPTPKGWKLSAINILGTKESVVISKYKKGVLSIAYKGKTYKRYNTNPVAILMSIAKRQFTIEEEKAIHDSVRNIVAESSVPQLQYQIDDRFVVLSVYLKPYGQVYRFIYDYLEKKTGLVLMDGVPSYPHTDSYCDRIVELLSFIHSIEWADRKFIENKVKGDYAKV